MNGILDCLVEDALGSGDQSARFLKSFQERTGCTAVIGVRSAWNALLLAIDTLGLAPGSTVAVPALSPAFYIDVLERSGLRAFVLDHSLATLQPDFAAITDTTPKPSALIVEDSLGLIPDFALPDGISIPIIEDASTAFAAKRDGKAAGSSGAIAILGMENSSLLTAGGAALILSYSSRNGQVLKNTSSRVPTNLLMHDMNAALGYAKLKGIDADIHRRATVYEAFSQALGGSKHSLLQQTGEGNPGYYAFPVLIDGAVKEVQSYAHKKDVATELAFSESIAACFPDLVEHCPNSRSLALRTVLFPLHQRIGSDDATRIRRVLATLP